MMKRTKMIISLILSVLMIISAFPLTAFAASGKTNDYEYDIITYDGEQAAVLTKYRGSATNITTPKWVTNDIPVVGLAGTFQGMKGSLNITVSEGVKFIGYATFKNCGTIGNKYCKITFPSSLEILGPKVFEEASLVDIVLPEGLKVIMNQAFYGMNSLSRGRSLILPDSVEKIGYDALNSPIGNVTSLHIGKNAQFWYLPGFNNDWSVSGFPYLFEGECENPFKNYWMDPLTDGLTVDEENPYYTAIDSALYTKDMKTLISAPVDKMIPYHRKSQASELYDFTVPEGVERILMFAFYDQPVRKVTLSSTVKTIYGRAFYDNTLEELEIPEDSALETVGVEAFYLSYLGGDIVLPKTVKTIRQYAFKGTKIESVDFEQPSSCNQIDIGAFMDCGELRRAVIPSSVKRLNYGKDWLLYSYVQSDAGTFQNCTALEELIIEDGAQFTETNRNFVTGCSSLKKLTIGKDCALESFEYSEIEDSSLEELDFSTCPNLDSLSLDVSGSKTLKRLDLSGTSLTDIYNGFDNCSALEEVVLPDHAVTIRNDAFKNCTALYQIDLSNVIFQDNAFENCPLLSEQIEKARLMETDGFYYYRYKDHVSVYKSKQEQAHIVIPDELSGLPVTEIGASAFEKDTTLLSIVFPSTLTKIGEKAFCGCKSMTALPVLPNGLREIGASAFDDMDRYPNPYKTDTYAIPDSVEVIGEAAFSGHSFRSLTLGNSVRELGYRSFSHYKPTVLTLPDALETMPFSTQDWYEVMYPTEIETLTLGANTKTVEGITDGDGTKRGRFLKLKEINVSEDNPYYTAVDGVLYSKDMTKLIAYPRYKEGDSFTLPSTVTEIGPYAFYAAYGLQSIYVPNTVTALGEGAFCGCRNITKAEFEEGCHYETLKNTFASCVKLEECVLPQSMKTKVMEGTFNYCSNLKAVTLPETLEVLGANTFYYTTSLQELTVPKTVTELGKGLLAYSGVRTVTFLNQVTKIPDEAFYRSAIKQITFKGNTGLSDDAIGEDGSINLALLRREVEIGFDAFNSCSNLKIFYISEEKTIEAGEYKDNEYLESVIIGSGVDEIKAEAFANCTNLRTAVIAETVTKIDDTAFENCEDLTIVATEQAPAIQFAKRMNINYRIVTGITVAPVPDQIYTGCAVTPHLTVTQDGVTLTEGKDYRVTYKDNVAVGTAKAAVTGLGEYAIFGATVNFRIVKAPVKAKNGWRKENGKWYYDKNGSPVKYWQKIENKWYYFNSNGVMMTGWLKSKGKWYYLTSSGAMALWWQKIGGKWYYFNSSGAMLADTSLNIKGKVYRFNASGACINP